MREKFMFFENFKQMADKLPDDLRLKFYDALTNYVFLGKESDDPIISALITGIKFSLDKVDGRSNNGGNHNPKGVNQHKIDQTKEDNLTQSRSKLVNLGQSWSNPLETETETETETRNGNREKEMVKEKVATAPRFTKPKLEEVQAYVAEQRLEMDARAFVDFYESKGWKVGSSAMKDWKAAARNWARRGKRKPVESSQSQDDYENSLSREERFQLFLKRCGVNQEGALA